MDGFGSRVWHSSVTQPVLTFTDIIQTHWTFGRWTVEETEVELAHLAPAEPNHKLIETGDPVWAAKVSVKWRETVLPIVPIELQIGTMIARDQQDRLAAALVAVDLGQLDRGLLQRTITDRDLDITDPRIPSLLGPLLGD